MESTELGQDASAQPGPVRDGHPERRGHDTLRAVLRWIGDATAIVLLVGVLWWLAGHDGGYPVIRFTTLGWLALLAVPAAAAEALPRPRLGWVTAAWAIGWLVALATAVERSLFVRPTLVAAVVAVTGLCALRLWRRPWGPALVAILLAAGFVAYAHRSFLQWWGWTSSGRAGRWMPLSWHNQAGTLSAAFALLFAGWALFGRRLIALAGAGAAAVGFAGAWLSSSRGALVAAALGLGVLLVTAVRGVGARATLLRVGGIAAAGAMVAVGLLAMNPPGASQPMVALEGRPGTADPAANTLARVRHAAAALRMFVDRPLLGHGPGSYRVLAPSYTSPQANLTASAHNEYAETLATGGLAVGAPLAVGVAVLFLLVVRAVRDAGHLTAPQSSEQGMRIGDLAEQLRRPLVPGAAAATVALLGHAAVDFDWRYPILPALTVIAAAVLSEVAGPARIAKPRWTARLPAVVVGVTVAALLAVGLAGAVAERRATAAAGTADPQAAARLAPWDAGRAHALADELVERGEYGAAVDVLDRALRWSPANTTLRAHRGVTAYLGGMKHADGLLEVFQDLDWRFVDANLVAASLLDGGAYPQAREVLDAAIARHPVYAGWGVTASALQAWTLLIRLEAETTGCAAAARAAERAVDAVPRSRAPEGLDVEGEIGLALEVHCSQV